MNAMGRGASLDELKHRQKVTTEIIMFLLHE
jgi:hypothetical protein